VFTGMFLHASVVQLAGNMLFLWIFGGSVEAALGRLRFVLLYLLAGVAAIALQVLLSPGSTEPTVGAAGAIAGVLGAYIVLYPRGRVLTVVLILVFTVLELPAVAMLVVWFGEQATFAATHLTTPIGGSGLVPFVAHIGGFLFGLATVRLLARRGGMPPPPTLPA
jgi:membrane associated rhomboid family serine protease